MTEILETDTLVDLGVSVIAEVAELKTSPVDNDDAVGRIVGKACLVDLGIEDVWEGREEDGERGSTVAEGGTNDDDDDEIVDVEGKAVKGVTIDEVGSKAVVLLESGTKDLGGSNELVVGTLSEVLGGDAKDSVRATA